MTEDVLILCGGLGTRLREAVSDRPKPLAPVNDRPFLDLLLDLVRTQGYERVILCTGYMSAEIESHYKRHNASGLEVLISEEKEPMGTAGAVLNAMPLIKTGSFIVMNGDSYSPVDLNKLSRFRGDTGAEIAMAVIKADNNGDYGSIEMDESGRVSSFVEKTSPGKYISAGVYCFDKKALRMIPPDRNCSLENEVFPLMVSKGGLFALEFKADLLDIGTVERYKFAQEYFRQPETNL